MMRTSVRAITLSLLAAALATAPLAGQEAALTYTDSQAARGKTTYDQICVACHGPNLDDGALGPPLKGPVFIQKYGGKTADLLWLITSNTMPSSAPGSLDRQTYADLLAYVLKSNDIVASDVELPPNPTQLGKMLIPAGGFSFMVFSPYVAKPAVDKPDPFARYTPVSEALLSDPPPAGISILPSCVGFGGSSTSLATMSFDFST